jgi:hypothetical protein
MDIVLLVLKGLGAALIIAGLFFIGLAGVVYAAVKRDPPEDWQ